MSKSAGSTIRSLISRRYPLDRILYFEPGSPAWIRHTTGEATLRQQIDAQHTEIVTGHHPFGIHALIPGPCRYYAIIRDPISRYISDYFTAVASSSHHLHGVLTQRQMSIWNFLEDPDFAPGDHLAQMLGGRPERTPMGTARAAAANIESSFAVVAIAERFNESVLLLAKSLGWDVPIYTKRNVAPISEGNRAARLAIGAVAQQRYADRFVPDRFVYAEADRLLSQRIATEGSDFQTALVAFAEIEAEVDRLVPSAAFVGYSFERVDFLPPIIDMLIETKAYRTVAEYLRQPPRSNVPDHNYVGHVDAIREGVAHGWAVDMARAAPVTVEAHASGRTLGRTRADQPRADVRRAGFGTDRCGFQLALPADVDVREIDFFFDDSAVKLPINPKIDMAIA